VRRVEHLEAGIRIRGCGVGFRPGHRVGRERWDDHRDGFGESDVDITQPNVAAEERGRRHSGVDGGEHDVEHHDDLEHHHDLGRLGDESS
jgi:hypothetical protein